MLQNWRCGDHNTEVISIQRDEYSFFSVFCGKGYGRDYKITTDVVRRFTLKAVEEYFASRFEYYASVHYYLPTNKKGFRAKIYEVDRRKECG